MHTTPLNDGQLLTPENSKYIRARCVVLQPGKDVGEHTTGELEELLLVFRGNAVVEVDDERNRLDEGHCAFIPPNTRHNVINPFDSELRYVYVRNLER